MKPLEYVVATTGRTGSNLLQRLLVNNGLNDPHEWFHPTLFGFQAAADQGTTCEQWLDKMREEKSVEDVFAIKLMATHPQQMRKHMREPVADRFELIQRLFANFRFIFLWRDDVERQALSFWRAQTSGKWAQWRDDLAKNEDAPPPPLDMEKIEHHIKSIESFNVFWTRFFDRTGIEPYRLSYESLDADRRSAILGIAEFLGRPIAGEPELDVEIVRQADAQTEQYLKEIKANRQATPAG